MVRAKAGTLHSFTFIDTVLTKVVENWLEPTCKRQYNKRIFYHEAYL